MKRVLLVPDGAADETYDELGGLTPLAAAHTPAMDALARRGVVGLVKTVPDDMAPGSDVANLAVLGYDPGAVFSGRSPLEAANIGVDLGPGDVAYRCNFVTIDHGVMKDNTAGDITSEDGRRCVAALQAALGGASFEFHAGLGYRNLMVWRGGELVVCTPPHDILDRPVAGSLPGEGGAAATSGGGAVEGTPAGAAALRDLMARARVVLAAVRPGTDIWFWGEGTAPSMPRFEELFGLRGAVVAAVDLVRGIGRYAGFDVIEVPGATGDLDTDYGAKAGAAIAALEDHDVVWVHVEAPDEAAHRGSLSQKITAIERVDREVLAPIVEAAASPAVLVLPDHHTPVRTRTHARGAVPFVFATARAATGSVPPDAAAAGVASGVASRAGGTPTDDGPAVAFSEAAAAATGLLVDDGPALMRLFLDSTG